MVRCCVNPACCAEFRLFSIGDLYALERRSTDTEFFWLCPACVPTVELCLDPTGCISVRPQSDAVRPHPPHPDGYRRLVTQRKLPTPWHRAGSPHAADALRPIWTRSASFVKRGCIDLANIKTHADGSEI